MNWLTGLALIHSVIEILQFVIKIFCYKPKGLVKVQFWSKNSLSSHQNHLESSSGEHEYNIGETTSAQGVKLTFLSFRHSKVLRFDYSFYLCDFWLVVCLCSATQSWMSTNLSLKTFLICVDEDVRLERAAWVFISIKFMCSLLFRARGLKRSWIN